MLKSLTKNGYGSVLYGPCSIIVLYKGVTNARYELFLTMQVLRPVKKKTQIIEAILFPKLFVA